MPSPAMKRPAAAAAAKSKGAKAARKSVEVKVRDPALEQVEIGLHMADVPQAVKSMLSSALETSLALYKADRHELQEKVVEMQEECLNNAELGLSRSLQDAEQKLAELETGREKLQEELEERRRELEAKREAASAKRGELAPVQESVRTAEAESKAAALAKAGGEQEIAKAEAQKEQTVGLAALVDGAIESGAAKEKADSLVKSLGVLALDHSLLAALPTALVKTPADRGSFEGMVLLQLKGELQKKLAALGEEIQQLQSSQAQLDIAASTAAASLDALKDRRAAVAAEFEEAQTTAQAAAGEVQRAESALSSLKREDLEKALSNARAALEAFKEGPRKHFDDLKAREAAKPEACAAEGEDPKPTEGAEQAPAPAACAEGA